MDDPDFLSGPIKPRCRPGNSPTSGACRPALGQTENLVDARLMNRLTRQPAVPSRTRDQAVPQRRDVSAPPPDGKTLCSHLPVSKRAVADATLRG